VDKDEMATELTELRAIFTRSLVATSDLDAGRTLEASDISAKKPAGGIPPQRLDDLIGRKLVRRVQRDGVFSFDDFGSDEG
jgi:sialic acid synthase SpsE